MQPGDRYAKSQQAQWRQQATRTFAQQQNAQRQQLATLSGRAQAQLRELESLRQQLGRIANATPQARAGLPGEVSFRLSTTSARVEFVNGMDRLRRKLNMCVKHQFSAKSLGDAQSALQGQVASGLEAAILIVVLAEKLSQFVCPTQSKPLERLAARAKQVGERLRALFR